MNTYESATSEEKMTKSLHHGVLQLCADQCVTSFTMKLYVQATQEF